jgi:hypothetical protein
MTFLIVNQASVEFSEQELTFELMQNLVGVPGEDAVFDFISEKFSDPNITIIIDDNYLGNPNCKPSCVIPFTRELINGQVLIVSENVSENVRADFIGLTETQINIVKEELLVLMKSDDDDEYLAYKAKVFI